MYMYVYTYPRTFAYNYMSNRPHIGSKVRFFVRTRPTHTSLHSAKHNMKQLFANACIDTCKFDACTKALTNQHVHMQASRAHATMSPSKTEHADQKQNMACCIFLQMESWQHALYVQIVCNILYSVYILPSENQSFKKFYFYIRGKAFSTYYSP